MFDIGFWELAVIGVIALLVVGPERLPALARNVGLWVGRIRRYVSHVKQDIERELHAEEVRQLIEKPGELDELRDIAKETASVFQDTRKAIDDADRAGGTSSSGGDVRTADTPAGAVTPPQAPDAPAGTADGGGARSGAPGTPSEPAAREHTVAEDEQQRERQGQR